MYSGTLITELRSTLVKEESPPETPAEQKSKCLFCFCLFLLLLFAEYTDCIQSCCISLCMLVFYQLVSVLHNPDLKLDTGGRCVV